ncbi:tetratricopeptide repeat protein [Streptomyces microflavus]|uniref:tetratricopeptide repeat protein n=1 Tax=Streptomyces microflavus TaxID=1919 RepID=UPI003B219343
MHNHHTGRHPALAELRSRLSAGMARLRLNQTDLAGKANLGRTTVSEALQPEGTAPSPRTVRALARALKLQEGELLELLRTATDADADSETALGRPIREWEPHDLEVHPADTALALESHTGARPLPGYVQRQHDQLLAAAVTEAAQGRSRLVVLVGTSSTGKTRACWEAVQPLAALGWRLWHPFDPTRAEAALEELHQVQPRTVVWLNEAQHYLGPPGAGERIAAAVHHLLVQAERGPVLVLATLWPKFHDAYTALPGPDDPDPHSRVRELLAGRAVTVPEAFDGQALAAATTLADQGDPLLANALTRAHTNGRLTQDLAGAPALLKRYEHASPPARALLQAAMDARRLDVGLHLPQAFLTEAATDYFDDTDYDHRPADWAEAAYAELARPVHGRQAPLSRTTPRTRHLPPTVPLQPTASTALPMSTVLRLADYLEQHGRNTRKRLCPPASFWHAAYLHLSHPEDLAGLARQAGTRHRLQWAHHLELRAAELGNTQALLTLAKRKELDGDLKVAESLARRAAEHDDIDALRYLAKLRRKAGAQEEAEFLHQQAARKAVALAGRRRTEAARERERTRSFSQHAADKGDTDLLRLVAQLEESGDLEGAHVLIRQAADRGATYGLLRLAELRERAGDPDGAETLASQAADRGATYGLLRLAELRERAGDPDGAETLAWQAADRGDDSALFRLAELRENNEDVHAAEDLYRQIASSSSEELFTRDKLFHRRWPHGLDPDGQPTSLWQR